MIKQLSVIVPSLALFVLLGGVDISCTPEQRAPARTALEVNQCINAIALRHLDAGDDFRDHEALAVMASEIAIECNPLFHQ